MREKRPGEPAEPTPKNRARDHATRLLADAPTTVMLKDLANDVVEALAWDGIEREASTVENDIHDLWRVLK